MRAQLVGDILVRMGEEAMRKHDYKPTGYAELEIEALRTAVEHARLIQDVETKLDARPERKKRRARR